jgi:hypothetical protein
MQTIDLGAPPQAAGTFLRLDGLASPQHGQQRPSLDPRACCCSGGGDRRGAVRKGERGRDEGKDYVVAHRDVMLSKFNA